MAEPSDRDRAVEQLLGRAASRPAPPVDAACCVKPEQLAAWVEGAVPADEAALIETHLAECDSCQATLAVFAESEPPSAATVPSWRRWSLRVLVPVAAASVVVLAWVAMTREPAPDPEMTMARVESFEAASRTEVRPSGRTTPAAPPAADSPEVRPSGRAMSAAPPVRRSYGGTDASGRATPASSASR